MTGDDALLAEVRPRAWVNPRPRARYDLVVIGAGTAGLVTAAGAAGVGAKVALIERHRMGGDCLNVGCVPSKALIAAARMAANARRAAEFGVSTGNVHVDFATVMDRMRALRASLAPHDSATRFRSLGVDVFFGEAAFASQEAVTVGGETLRFKRAAICTGTRPVIPEIEGLGTGGYLTNEDAFDLTSRPDSLAVLGGGPIGCEMAQAFARLGTRVTLFERGERVLPRDDAAAASLVQKSLVRDGVDLRVGRTVSQVNFGDERWTLRLRASESLEAGESVSVNSLFIAVGRRPNVEGLGLDAAGVAFDSKKGVQVDDRLRTTNRRIYAAGDICSRFKFTHAADAMARIVIQNSLFVGRKQMSALTIPWCTYTSPEVAQVGLTPERAEKEGIAVDAFEQTFENVDRTVLDGETKGFVKVLVKRGGDRIVGGTIVDEHAGDLIGLLAHAMTHGQGLRTFSSTIFPYPTRVEALRKLGDAYNRTRLTPTAKRVLSAWLRWT